MRDYIQWKSDQPLHAFRPAPIRAWAKWTYQEGEKRTLTRARWMPFVDMRGGQKSGISRSGGVTLPTEPEIAPATIPEVTA